MRRWYAKGRSLLGATTLCVGLFGCAAEHDDSLRLSDELARARADVAAQQAHSAELEARLAHLERDSAGARGAEQRNLLNHLDRLLDMNERLLAARDTPAPNAAQRSEPQVQAAPKPAPTASVTSSAAPTIDVEETNEEQQLRALVEKMRGRRGSLRGGLTVEQENALHVLLRSERKLDSENPLLPAFY